MKYPTIWLSICLFCISSINADETAMTPALALQKLLQGNERYINDKLEHPNRSSERREAVTATQRPFAVIVGCSDSRVSPEIIFDQGIGDLFVVRDAGNVVGPIEIASIEYSAVQLQSSIIVVLGHESCGAIKAVLAGQTQDIKPIAEQVELAMKNYTKPSNSPLEAAIKANVRGTAAAIKNNAHIAKLIADKKIGVVGGYYHLGSGKVELCCDLSD